MRQKAYLLGIDISTTGAKALLVDPDGKVAASVAEPLDLSIPRPLWSEQDPQDWWETISKSIRRVLRQAAANGSDVLAVGLTGQMHGLVMLDENGQVLRPAILWNDQRTGAQCDEIRERLGKEKLIQITGNDALTGFTAPKILWVQENEPGVYAKTKHILLPKDYVRYRLTGEYASDKAGGSGMILMDIRQREWSPEVLEALEIDPLWLPQSFEGTAITGTVTEEAALETGLAAGTPVMGGGGDQAAQAVGVGAVREGIVALTLGTSGVVFASTSEPFIEPNGLLHSFCHAVPQRWHLMGVMLSAAGSLRWFRDAIAPDMDFGELVAEANAVPAGSEGLFFMPYLTGERTPYPDPLARGGFVGLTIRHSRAHMTRALLEGVAFGIKDIFELMRDAGLQNVEQVRISGGGAKSPLWRQIMADVLNVELVMVNTTEGAAFGAALLAGVGVDIWGDIEQACHDTIKLNGKTTANKDAAISYTRSYKLFRELYPSLKDIFHEILF